MIYSAHRFPHQAAFEEARASADALALDPIGTSYTPTTYDALGGVLVAGTALSGFYANAVWQDAVPESWHVSQIPNTEAPRWWSGVPREPAPAPALTQEMVATAVDDLIEETAKSMGYKTAANCISYASSQNPVWAAEARALSAFRDAVWLTVYSLDPANPPETLTEVMGFLPQFVRQNVSP